MALGINEKLNLVIPLYDAHEAVYAYVHSAPISREVFEANFLLISKTFAAVHGEGLGEIAGPRISAMMLREVAKRMAGPDGAEELAAPLLNEIRRLSNVIMQVNGRWSIVPYEEAVARRMFDGDDLSEVENALVFFTVLSVMHRRQVLGPILSGAAKLWGAQTSSLSCTAYLASLPTSTETETTREKSMDQASPVNAQPAPSLRPPVMGATVEISMPGPTQGSPVRASSLPS